ncbi:heavy-metal-associated domain-containing protein [bacterium]|nr:heavy-metal-associated domain-containing protein [bacterium]
MLTTIEINNVRCKGCADTIKKTLKKEGFDEVTIDLSCEPRKVTLDIKNEASLAQVKIILRSLGYPFCDEEISFSDSAILKVRSFVSCAVGKFNVEDSTNNS